MNLPRAKARRVGLEMNAFDKHSCLLEKIRLPSQDELSTGGESSRREVDHKHTHTDCGIAEQILGSTSNPKDMNIHESGPGWESGFYGSS